MEHYEQGGQHDGSSAEVGSSVFISNLQWWTSDVEVEVACSEFGRVTGVRFIEDKACGKSRGMAIVDYTEHDAATRCIQGMSGCVRKAPSPPPRTQNALPPALFPTPLLPCVDVCPMSNLKKCTSGDPLCRRDINGRPCRVNYQTPRNQAGAGPSGGSIGSIPGGSMAMRGGYAGGRGQMGGRGMGGRGGGRGSGMDGGMGMGGGDQQQQMAMMGGMMGGGMQGMAMPGMMGECARFLAVHGAYGVSTMGTDLHSRTVSQCPCLCCLLCRHGDGHGDDGCRHGGHDATVWHGRDGDGGRLIQAAPSPGGAPKVGSGSGLRWDGQGVPLKRVTDGYGLPASGVWHDDSLQ